MRFGSVCSGIEAASCAWHPLGWQAAFVSEIEPFPCSVLAHHYPTVPNLGDMTKFKEWGNYDIDVLVGGTPCQSFSVAGLRKGLADPRGNLMLTYLAIADQYRPRWLVWENVPGVLSSNGGKDFGTFLGGLGELGYGFAYRVLDAQYFGVPQRRRRVFVIGCLGDWRRAAAVLFERHSLQGHPAPSRQTREDVAASLIGGIDYENNGHGHNEPTGPLLKGSPAGGGKPLPAIVTRTMCMATGQAGAEIGADIAPTLNCNHEAPIAFDCKASGVSGFGVGQVASTMRAMGHAATHQNGGGHLAVAMGVTIHGTDGTATAASYADTAGCLRTKPPGSIENSSTTVVHHAMQVRRLTPRECERLQGFPDDYTLLPIKKAKRRSRLYEYVEIDGQLWRLSADGPRYKALGNSMAVPVMRWIGERIQTVDAIRFDEAAA